MVFRSRKHILTVGYLRPGNNWCFDVVFDDENRLDATTFTISADAEVAEEIDHGVNETG